MSLGGIQQLRTRPFDSIDSPMELGEAIEFRAIRMKKIVWRRFKTRMGLTMPVICRQSG
jgi:hypothetical protein